MMNPNHRMVIYRGLPGSGKTTIAMLERKAQAKDCACEVFEADHYYMKDGVYHFDPGKIGLAHSDCARRVMNFMEEHKNSNALAIVSNTAIAAWEISPYIMLANVHNWWSMVITIVCPLRLCMQRETHNVPDRTMMEMAGTLATEKLPSHWNQKVIFNGVE